MARFFKEAGVRLATRRTMRRRTRLLAPVERLEARQLMAASIDRISPDRGLSASDGITNTSDITLFGNALPGEAVQISKSGTNLGTVFANSAGDWSIGLQSLTLSEGTHIFSAIAASQGVPARFTAHIDLLPPAAPNIVAYSQGSGAVIGPSRVINTSTLSVLGSCEVSPLVRIHLDRDAVAAWDGPDPFGDWSASITVPDGRHSITATAMDVAGNISRPSAAFAIYVDTIAPAAAQITGVSPASAPGVVVANQFELQGTAESGVIVSVVYNEQVVGNSVTNASAAWSFDAGNLNLGPGSHTFATIVYDGYGNHSPVTRYTVVVAGSLPERPTLGSLTRVPTSSGFTFSIAGAAQPGSTVVVSQQGVGAVGQVTTAADGKWSFTHHDAQVAEGFFRYTAATRDAAGRTSASSNARMFQPNIVFVNIDDMRDDELQYMPFVYNTLAAQGTRFTNSFVSNALSGPSRASLLTGLYSQNNGEVGNAAPLGSDANSPNIANLPVWLQSAGYRTGLFGKYGTSFYDGTPQQPTVPAGWDDYRGRYAGGLFYNAMFNENGTIVRRGSAPEEYTTDVWANQAVNFINATNQGDDPLFAYFAPIGAHAPYTPAPRHIGDYQSLTFALPPSLNIPPEGGDALTPEELETLLSQRRSHLETLLSIDEAVARFYDTLRTAGELDNTVFIVTADNGFQWGEHAVLHDKNRHYEESIRVPLAIWDGRNPVDRTTESLAVNIDLAPTIADLAGAQPTYATDGRSLRQAIYDTTFKARNDFLIETFSVGERSRGLYGTHGDGIRNLHWKYNEYNSGRREMFHLPTDPHELRNLADDPHYTHVREMMQARLNQLRSSDREGPEMKEVTITIATDDAGYPVLRVRAMVDDTGNGNANVGTPEYFIDTLGAPGTGQSVRILDGDNNSSREAVGADIPFSALLGLRRGNHKLWIRGRDLHGNFGPAIELSFKAGRASRLASMSDTGVNGDGITTRSKVQFLLPNSAGANIVAVAINEATGRETRLEVGKKVDGTARLNGTLAPGRYRIVAAMERSNGTTFSVSGQIYMVGRIMGDTLIVGGTNRNDQILVTDQTIANRIAVYIAGTFAGTYERVPNVLIRGYEGNDILRVAGDIHAQLHGDDGDDTLIGGSGNDRLEGGTGNNNLRGNAGHDNYAIVNGDPPANHIINVVWTDRIWEQAGEGHDTLEFLGVDTPIDRTIEGLLGIGSFKNRFLVTRRALFGDVSARELEQVSQ